MILSKLKIIFYIKIKFLKSFLVYKFTYASCSSSYIGKTCCHFKTRIEKHIKKHNESLICKHQDSTATCFDWYNTVCFEIVNKAKSKFYLKVKAPSHINWRKVNLNPQQNHLALTLCYGFCLPFFFLFCFLFFCVSPLTIIFIISPLIIGIFYSLNYTFLLLYLIITNLEIDFTRTM